MCQYKTTRGKNKGKNTCKKPCENGKKYCETHAKLIDKKFKREKERDELKKKKNEEKERKRLERNELKKKKDDEKSKEKERKRLEREKKKKLRAPKTGTSAKGRDGTTRHGMVVSYSKYHAPEITIVDIDNRNKLFNIDPNKCFWCKIKNKECGDHAHPCCNTTNHEYSFTNALNIVPSCRLCNSKKGGKRLDDWINMLDWSEEEKKKYRNWLYENKEKLLFNDKDVDYLERQFKITDELHSIYDYCLKNKLEYKDFINFKIPTDL